MIKLKNITKRYGEKVVYQNFNLDIEQGKILVVLGESGTGKTTLLNILGGLTDFEGEIENKPQKISWVFQNNRLVPNLTAKENVSLVNANANASELLKQVGLESQENALPKTLSAGMQRRVAIARALAYSAPLVLMDEPFINLDLALKYTLLEKVKRLAKEQGLTLVVVTHDIKEAVSFADRIVVVADNNIVCDVKEIKENTEKELFGIMMGISKEKII